MKEEIKTLADTIIWLARERMQEESFQNINSAIHATKLDITEHLMEFMKDQKGTKAGHQGGRNDG